MANHPALPHRVHSLEEFRLTHTRTYAGKVGTGFSNKLLAQLNGRLAALGQSEPTVAPPKGIRQTGVHGVRPGIVVETSFTEWTKDGMPRHPSFLGIREDKLRRSRNLVNRAAPCYCPIGLN
jgi:ATP-dependent DNA ligase